MSDWAPKRFWTKAEIGEVEGGYAVLLDGRPVRTPLKAQLVLPGPGLAQLVADEWEAQEKVVDPTRMPATRAANSALDKVAPQKAEVAAIIAAYAETDLLCYRAVTPEALTHRQAAAWDPLLDWAAETYGARLAVTQGVMPVIQDPEALARLAAPVREMSAFALAGFHDLVSLSGSLVLGLAAARGARPLDALWALSRLDETFQAEQWGQDEEADALAALKQQAFMDAGRFYHLATTRA